MSRRSPWWPRLVFGIALLMWLAWAGHWVWSNGYFVRPTPSDANAYRADAAEFHVALEDGGIVGWLRAGFEYRGTHPPLFPMTAALVSWPFDAPTSRECWFTVALYATLLAFGIRRLARRFGSEWFATAATVLTLCCPVIVGNARPFYPQMPMIAVVIWALDALLRADRFRKLGPSLAFGALVGVASLIKQLTPCYLIGGAVAALAYGLRDPLHRARVARNAGLGLFTALLFVGSWYPFHLDTIFKYADAVVGEAGQQLYSSGVPVLSFARWTYFAKWMVIEGFAAPLALAVIVASIVSLWRLRRSVFAVGNSEAAILLVNGVASWAIITVGQVAAYSFYVMHLVPLACMVTVHAVGRIRPAWWRIAAIAWLVGASLWNLRLTAWTIERLPSGSHWIGPVDLVPTISNDLIKYARVAGAAARPEAEAWPNAAFVERILAAPVRERPRVTIVTEKPFQEPFLHHPFVERNTLDYEATLRRRRLEYVDLHRVKGGMEALAAAVHWLDWLIVDERITPYENVKAMLESAEIEHELIDRRQITWFSSLALVRIKRPWEGPRYQTLGELDRPGVVAQRARFDCGWTMRGHEVVPAPNEQSVLLTYWEADADTTEGWDAVCVAKSGDKTLGSKIEALEPAAEAAGGPRLLTVLFDRFKEPTTRDVTWSIRVARRDHKTVVAKVVETEYAKRGETTILIRP